MKYKKRHKKKLVKQIFQSLREKAVLNNNPGKLIREGTRSHSKKDRKSSGWVTPRLVYPQMKYSEIAANALEPQEFWDDWQDKRDGMRHNTSTDQLYHKWRGCCCKKEYVYEQNNKLIKQIRIRKARKKKKQDLNIVEKYIKHDKTDKRGHRLWMQEQELLKSKNFIKAMMKKGYSKEQILETFVCFGKWKYDFESPKGKISMIQLATHIPKGWEWEIFAYDNKKLFMDCRRFRTKKEAMKEIIRLLK